jgi:hypothetical protein
MQAAEGSGFAVPPQLGHEIIVANRRYFLGRGLKEDLAFKSFKSAQLGLASDLAVQIPKSSHRLRLPGAGSRYVHGGAALQDGQDHHRAVGGQAALLATL